MAERTTQSRSKLNIFKINVIFLTKQQRISWCDWHTSYDDTGTDFIINDTVSLYTNIAVVSVDSLHGPVSIYHILKWMSFLQYNKLYILGKLYVYSKQCIQSNNNNNVYINK